MTKKKTLGLMTAIVLGLGPIAAIVTAARAAAPETVMITYLPRPGAEQELVKAIADHWATARKLDLVQPDPHVTVRMKDGEGRVVLVDIFTWRDRDLPDNAPAAIMKTWGEMNRLTESRDGRPGLDITEVRLITPPASR
jgi:hypothetical protein